MSFSQFLFLCADKVNSFFYKLFCRNRAQKNFQKNKALQFPAEKVLSDGFITRQASLSDFRFGIKNLSYGGCGVIAIYNILRSLKKEKGLCELICELEKNALVSGVFGLSPHAVGEYFERYGHKVQRIGGRKKVRRANVCGKHIIHLYFNRNLSAHYVAGIPQSDGKFRFCNADVGGGREMTFSQYHETLEKERKIMYSFLFVIG